MASMISLMTLVEAVTSVEDIHYKCLIAVAISLLIHHVADYCSSFQKWLMQVLFSQRHPLQGFYEDVENSPEFQRQLAKVRSEAFNVGIELGAHVSVLGVAYIVPSFAMAQSSARREMVGTFVFALLLLVAFSIMRCMMRGTFQISDSRFAVVNVCIHAALLWRMCTVSHYEVFLLKGNVRMALRIALGIADMNQKYGRVLFWNALMLVVGTLKAWNLGKSLPSASPMSSMGLIHNQMQESALCVSLTIMLHVMFAAHVRACLQAVAANSDKTMLSHLLTAFCDAQVHLGPELKIVGPSQKLSKILNRGESLEDTNFLACLAAPDKDRFKKLIQASCDARFDKVTADGLYERPRSLPSALHASMIDSESRELPAEFFHSVFVTPDGELHHLIGICVDSPDACINDHPDIMKGRSKNDMVTTLEAPEELCNLERSNDCLEALADRNQPSASCEHQTGAPEADESVSSLSSASSAGFALKELDDIVIAFDPFESQLPIRRCTFNFLRPQETDDIAQLPKVSDWLTAHDFRRFISWTEDCVNEACSDGKISQPQLDSLAMQLGTSAVHIGSAQLLVHFTQHGQEEAEEKAEEEANCQEEVKADGDDQEELQASALEMTELREYSSQQSGNSAEEADQQLHVEVSLRGFSGSKRLRRLFQNRSRKVQNQGRSGGVRLPRIQE